MGWEGRRGVKRFGGTVAVAALMVLLASCREAMWSGQIYLANLSSSNVNAELVFATGRCEDIWDFGEGFLREDDFRPGQFETQADYQVTSEAIIIPPKTLVPMDGCAARINFDLQDHAVIWDPATPTIDRLREPESDELRHPQIMQIVDGADARELRYGEVAKPIRLVSAHDPIDPGPCAGVVGEPVESSTSGLNVGGTLLSIVEHGDGCMTLKFSEGGELDTNEDDAGTSTTDGDDAGVESRGEDDAGSADVDPDPSTGRLYLCVPRDLLPVEEGMEVDVYSSRTQDPVPSSTLLISPAGESRPRLVLWNRTVGFEHLDLPLSVVAGDPAYGGNDEHADVEPASCGWLRESPGVAWRVMDVLLAGERLAYGREVEVNGVTYVTQRVLRPVFGWVEPGLGSGSYQSIEVHHDVQR